MPDHGLIDPITERSHPVELDSALGRELGFTSDLFAPGSYLLRERKTIIISMIIAAHPGRGDFSCLVRTIREKGYDVEIPTPLGLMEHIVLRWGMKKKIRRHPVMGPVEIWYFQKRRAR